jgi:hypothetical protein
MKMSAGGQSRYALVDGILSMTVDSRIGAGVEYWLPRDSRPAVGNESFAACIHVVAAGDQSPLTPIEPGTGRPTLSLDGVELHLRRAAGRLLRRDSPLSGSLDLISGDATVRIPIDDPGKYAPDARSMLTISAALLLLRNDCALVHAGAVVAPDGGAWLLVGDSHAGKSTTCLNLIRAGWDYLADDQVVLRQVSANDACTVDASESPTLEVIGWQRGFHLDSGWDVGARFGVRGEIDPIRFGPGIRRRSAPLAGMLILGIEAEAPTRLEELAQGAALALIVRQTPWFLADRAEAHRGLALLTAAARRPSFSLRLGLDVYKNAERLVDVLAPLGAVGVQLSLPGDKHAR